MNERRYLFVAPIFAVNYLVEWVRICFAAILACRFLAWLECLAMVVPAFLEWEDFVACENVVSTVVAVVVSVGVSAAVVVVNRKKKYVNLTFSPNGNAFVFFFVSEKWIFEPCSILCY